MRLVSFAMQRRRGMEGDGEGESRKSTGSEHNDVGDDDDDDEEEADEEVHFGAIMDDNEHICDLTASLPRQWQPLDSIAFLQRGADALRRADEAMSERANLIPLSQVRLLAPVTNPGKVIVVENVIVGGDKGADDEKVGQQHVGKSCFTIANIF
ncbi:hypothetical protein GUITHDRAFT_100580 [Guillardia theta CCMP2712]|uniref:Uncharacterized protein n=1 Tax=Guillardia theta (strain CCMP2712) TaxID=905079 RepID=L1JYE1_GUITC|nr:hypothetical protein GUITHDRAFT_100580 [Guillardia theta CCMP2712]EKX53596.1 hypothetical protein GUITHDRAFT_100580 [Guillardia theta CCMP2712]|eukprot:XP_005840576.1 hypothetical protein GUITHDRAFT_100580 [Guillardia theta CCMP2712]